MKNRILSLLLCFALCLSLLTGCGSSSTTGDSSAPAETSSANSSTAEELPTLDEIPAEALADPVKYATDGALTADTVVMTVNGQDITAGYYLYWAAYYDLQMRSYYNYYYGVSATPSMAMDADGTTFAQLVAEQAEKNCTSYYALESTCADKGITLTDEQKSELEAYIAQQAEDMNSMTALCTSPEGQGKVYNQYQLALNLQDSLFGDGGEEAVTEETMQDYVKDNEVYNCRYILFPVTETTAEDSSEVTDDAEEQEKKCKEAYDELSKLKGDKLLTKFEEYQTSNPDGNTNEFQYDKTQTMTDGFKEAVAALNIGELGMTGRTGYGYFVVLRLEPNTESLKSDYITERFSAKVDEWMDAATVERADALDALDMEVFLTNMQVLQNTVRALQSASTDSADAS